MNSLATRRLIDAAATLEPADRALLNLWVNRGIDATRLGQLTGLSADALALRRSRIVDRLSDELGLPPGDINAALTQIAATSSEQLAIGVNGHAPAGGTTSETGVNGAPPAETVAEIPPAETVAETPPAEAVAETPPAETVAETPPAETVAETPPAETVAETPPAETVPETPPAETVPETPPAETVPETPPAETVAETPAAATAAAEPDTRGRRRKVWIAVAILVAALIAGELLALATSGGTAHRGATPAPTSTTATATASATSAAPAPTASAPATTTPKPPPPRTPIAGRPTALAGLPGGLSGARGSVTLAGSDKSLKLRLTVTHLADARHGHYEVWLYNSVIDAIPLGRLKAGVHSVAFKLPQQARAYRWIDVSLQPAGAVNHSGASELRAPNPARAR